MQASHHFAALHFLCFLSGASCSPLGKTLFKHSCNAAILFLQQQNCKRIENIFESRRCAKNHWAELDGDTSLSIPGSWMPAWFILQHLLWPSNTAPILSPLWENWHWNHQQATNHTDPCASHSQIHTSILSEQTACTGSKSNPAHLQHWKNNPP